MSDDCAASQASTEVSPLAAPRFPVIVLERETGDIDLLLTLRHVVDFVEEFIDIVADDFRLWDARGRVVVDVAGILAGAPLGLGECDPACGDAIRKRLARGSLSPATAEALRSLLEPASCGDASAESR
jgi:hypothetical protein